MGRESSRACLKGAGWLDYGNALRPGPVEAAGRITTMAVVILLLLVLALMVVVVTMTKKMTMTMLLS